MVAVVVVVVVVVVVYIYTHAHQGFEDEFGVPGGRGQVQDVPLCYGNEK